jgi:molybdopterin converting factor small subunit
VYRSDDRGDTWLRLDGNGLPSVFGFPLMLDPTAPDTAYVIPETAFEHHYSPGGRLAVHRTRDGGETWERMTDGLPEHAWAAVLREASASDAESVEVAAEIVGDALRALPLADLIFNERGALVQHLNVYVDGTDHRERGGLESPLAGAREIRVLAMVSGG